MDIFTDVRLRPPTSLQTGYETIPIDQPVVLPKALSYYSQLSADIESNMMVSKAQPKC
jgi:hypothetical protein